MATFSSDSRRITFTSTSTIDNTTSHGRVALRCLFGIRGRVAEYLVAYSGLPVGEASHVKFSLQSKNELYTCVEQSFYRDEGESLRFSYPADHSLTAFEEQTTRLVTEYKGNGECLSVHHPEPQAEF